MNAEFSNFSFLCATLNAMPQGGIPPSWVLSDDQSTICCFKDKECLRNVRKASRSITIHCSARTTTADMIEDLPGFPEPVWCDPQGIANVLSMDRVEAHFEVTHQNRVFLVHKPDGSVCEFVRAKNGLRHWDITKDVTDAAGRNSAHQPKEHRSADDKETTNNTRKKDMKFQLDSPQATPAESQECTLVSDTAAGDKTKCSLADCERAEVARMIQEITGQSLADYLVTIDENLMMNCPVERRDVKAAEDIFGPSELILQGKTTRCPSPIHTQEITVIPPDMCE